MFSNTVSLEYDLVPDLKFFEKFPNFTNSLRVSDSTVTINNALYSSSTKKLRVSLSYNETIAGKTITLSYTPASSPYSHALSGSSHPWPARVGNGMTLAFYEEQVYNDTKVYDYLILGIVIGTLFVFVLSLFFRKMIGV